MEKKQEPLALEIKSLMMKRALSQLRKKQKIFMKKSACIMGVVDEYEVLDYGEVFLSVPDGVIEGPVVQATGSVPLTLEEQPVKTTTETIEESLADQ